MSWFDIIVILILLGGFINGMKKGLTMQLAGLVAIILGAIFAGKVANMILPFLLKTVNISAGIALVLSYALAFIIIVFSIKFIGKMLHTIIEVLHIGFINKILGAVLGVLSASLVLSILVNLGAMLDSEETILTENLKSETFFYSKIQRVAPIIVPYLKEEVWERHIEQRLKHIEKKHEDENQNAPSVLSKLNCSNCKTLNLHINS
ncbi:MAG: CvpA family protein [Bacteroidales bacterium]|nr:CvpA family protein [Bacteroidales bacterium]